MPYIDQSERTTRSCLDIGEFGHGWRSCRPQCMYCQTSHRARESPYQPKTRISQEIVRLCRSDVGVVCHAGSRCDCFRQSLGVDGLPNTYYWLDRDVSSLCKGVSAVPEALPCSWTHVAAGMIRFVCVNQWLSDPRSAMQMIETFNHDLISVTTSLVTVQRPGIYQLETSAIIESQGSGDTLNSLSTH